MKLVFLPSTRSDLAHPTGNMPQRGSTNKDILLLRAEIHRLFDARYVTVDTELRFVVSMKLRQEFTNGRMYYAFAGRLLATISDHLIAQADREHPD